MLPPVLSGQRPNTGSKPSPGLPLALAASFCTAACTGVLTAALAPLPAHALLLFTAREVNGDVVISGGGTTTIDNSASSGIGTSIAAIDSGYGQLGLISQGVGGEALVGYTLTSGPENFGTSAGPFGGSAVSGNSALFLDAGNNPNDPLYPQTRKIYFLADANGVVNISIATRFDSTSIAALGLTAGSTYTWSWGNGSDQQLILQIDPVPGPLPLLGGAAAFGWSRRLRRRLKTSRRASEPAGSAAARG